MWKFFIIVLAGMAAAASMATESAESVQDLVRGARAMAQVAEESAKGGLSDSAFADLVRLRTKQDDNRVEHVVVISVMTVLSLAMVLFALRFHARTSPSTLVNASSLIFIVYGTVILTLMVDTEAQLTAATGILGAVAGYMFGSMRRGAPSEGKAERT